MILDGWGNAPDPKVSALDKAHTPYIDSLYRNYSFNSLRADGEHVGLPEGQMGNSEVGHMNLGAGRIVYQDLAKINLAVENNELQDEKVLTDSFQFAKKQGKKVHLLGLLSDGGVHSHINHLEGLFDLMEDFELPEVYLHAFTDGRDVDPQSGKYFVSTIENKLKGRCVKFASLIGRYYAMDRDQRWERVKIAYDLLVRGKGSPLVSRRNGSPRSGALAGTPGAFVAGLERRCVSIDARSGSSGASIGPSAHEAIGPGLITHQRRRRHAGAEGEAFPRCRPLDLGVRVASTAPPLPPTGGRTNAPSQSTSPTGG